MQLNIFSYRQMQYLAESKLSCRQLVVLIDVYEHENEVMFKDVKRVLKISGPALCRALDHLGELGYTRRSRSDQDRRDCIIHQTPEGKLWLEGLISP